MNPDPAKSNSEPSIESGSLQKDQTTQTHRSVSSSTEPRLPLPRDLSRSERGSVTVFEFCRVLQNPESPKSVTIIKEKVTEESVNHPASSTEEEHTSNRYKYCREVIQPFLNLKPFSSEITDEIIKEALSSGNTDFSDCPSAEDPKEIPDQEDKFSYRDLSEGSGQPITDSSRESSVNYTDAVTSYSSLDTKSKENINNKTDNAATESNLSNMSTNNNSNQMNVEDVKNSADCTPICDPDDPKNCKLPPNCKQSEESIVSESPKVKQKPPCGPPNVHIKPKCKKEVKCKPKIKKVCSSGSVSQMDEEKSEVIIASPPDNIPEPLTNENKSDVNKVLVTETSKLQDNTLDTSKISGFSDIPRTCDPEKNTYEIIDSDLSKTLENKNIEEKSNISLVSDFSDASENFEEDKGQMKCDSIKVPEENKSEKHRDHNHPELSIKKEDCNKEKQSDVIILSDTNDRPQIEKIHKLGKESKLKAEKGLTPNERAKTDATKCKIPYFPNSNNDKADTKMNDSASGTKINCPPCPFRGSENFQDQIAEETKANVPSANTLKEVFEKSQSISKEDCDDDGIISSSLSKKRSINDKRARPFYDTLRCEDETDYSSPFNFDCDDMDENPEHKQTLVDAHNETLSTIKVAMEDFMEKICKKTQEAAHLIATEGAKAFEGNSTEPYSANAKEIISKVLTRVDSALTVLGVNVCKSFDNVSKMGSYNNKASPFDKPSPPDEVAHDHVPTPTSSSYFSVIKTKICSMFRDEPKAETPKQLLSPKSSKRSKSSDSDSEDEEDYLDNSL